MPVAKYNETDVSNISELQLGRSLESMEFTSAF
jgi:hypothetical protein